MSAFYIVTFAGERRWRGETHTADAGHQSRQSQSMAPGRPGFVRKTEEPAPNSESSEADLRLEARRHALEAEANVNLSSEEAAGYAEALKNVFDLFPANATPSVSTVAGTFSSPYLRHEFGTAKLLETGWPSSDAGQQLPANLPQLAGSRSHTALSNTTLPLPLVPRPLALHSRCLVPRQRPLSHTERAHGRQWQQRHHSLAAHGVSAFEACAKDTDSPIAEELFRSSLQALRYNRFQALREPDVAQARRDLDEPSPPPTPSAPPELGGTWESVLLRASADWGDMSQADELCHGRRQTEVDRMREELRGKMPVLRAVFERFAGTSGLAITAAAGGRLPADPDGEPRLALGQYWLLLREAALEQPGMTATMFSADFQPLSEAQQRALPLPRDGPERRIVLSHHPLRSGRFEHFVRALLRAAVCSPELAAISLPHERFHNLIAQYVEPVMRRPLPPSPPEAAAAVAQQHVPSLAGVYQYWRASSEGPIEAPVWPSRHMGPAGVNFNELLMLLQATHLTGPDFSPQDASVLFGELTSLRCEPAVCPANRETTMCFDTWVRFFVGLSDVLLPELAPARRVEHVFSYLYVHTRTHQERRTI